MKKRKKMPEYAPVMARLLGSSPPPMFDATGVEASYEAFKAEALAVDGRDVKTFTGNATVVLQNVNAGVEAVLAQRVRIENDPEAPRVDFVRIETTARVAEALVFASLRATHAVEAKSATAEKVSEAFALRDVILASAVSLAKSGRLDKKEVARIQAGGGPVDAAEDCIALASLFRRNEASVKGATPITEEQLRRASELGTELLATLMPTGAPTPAKKVSAVTEAAQMRDRMAALLGRYHGYLVRTGGWLWGYDVAEHVPPLRSRTVASGGGAGAGEATPEETPEAEGGAADGVTDG